MTKLLFMVLASWLLQYGASEYVLVDDYMAGGSFLDQFDFFSAPDPTNGTVTYVDRPTAIQSGLVDLQNGSIYIGVDHSQVTSEGGRQSVRLSSKKAYNLGLVIVDLLHMPGSICGVWPAFWTVGPNWPIGGEIDIIEGVNLQASNRMTLHTGSSCSIQSNGSSTGALLGTDCEVTTTNTNSGCSFDAMNGDTYGDTFNNNTGGVYAMEWTAQAIHIWFFERYSLPVDILIGTPDPRVWSTPAATFTGQCQFDTSFRDQKLACGSLTSGCAFTNHGGQIFDTTFCGYWAGSVWQSDPVCSTKATTCEDFVANNPTEFTNAFWLVSSLKVYQQSSGTAQTSASSTPTISPAASGSGTSTTTIAITPGSDTTGNGIVPSPIEVGPMLSFFRLPANGPAP